MVPHGTTIAIPLMAQQLLKLIKPHCFNGFSIDMQIDLFEQLLGSLCIEGVL